MKGAKTVIFLGAVVLLMPFVALPLSWKTTLLMLVGLCIILIGLRNALPQTKAQPRKKKVSTKPTPKADTPQVEDSVGKALIEETTPQMHDVSIKEDHAMETPGV